MALMGGIQTLLSLYAWHLYPKNQCVFNFCKLLTNSPSCVFFLFNFRTNTTMLLMKLLRQFGKCWLQPAWDPSCASLQLWGGMAELRTHRRAAVTI